MTNGHSIDTATNGNNTTAAAAAAVDPYTQHFTAAQLLPEPLANRLLDPFTGKRRVYTLLLLFSDMHSGSGKIAVQVLLCNDGAVACRSSCSSAAAIVLLLYAMLKV
jgi:hypothetical protein